MDNSIGGFDPQIHVLGLKEYIRTTSCRKINIDGLYYKKQLAEPKKYAKGALVWDHMRKGALRLMLGRENMEHYHELQKDFVK